MTSIRVRSRSGRLARATLTAAVCAALTLGTAAVANAQVARDTDLTGDLASRGGAGYVPQPTETQGDVTGSVITHSDKRVKIRLNFVDLVRWSEVEDEVDAPDTQIWAQLVTDADVKADFSFNSSDLEMAAFQGAWGVNSGRKSGRLTVHVDYDKNYATFSLPRSFIGDPQWVKFKVRVWSSPGGLVEDVFRDGPIPATTDDTYRIPLKWSPRVYTGDTTAPRLRHSQTLADDQTDWVLWDRVKDFPGVVARTNPLNGDIKSATVTYGEERVNAVVEYYDLEQNAAESVSTHFEFQGSNNSEWYYFTVRSWNGHWDGSVYGHSEYKTLTCDIRPKIDYEANTVSISVSRWCLNRPANILAWVSSEVSGGDWFSGNNFSLTDHAYPDNYYPETLFRS